MLQNNHCDCGVFLANTKCRLPIAAHKLQVLPICVLCPGAGVLRPGPGVLCPGPDVLCPGRGALCPGPGVFFDVVYVTPQVKSKRSLLGRQAAPPLCRATRGGRDAANKSKKERAACKTANTTTGQGKKEESGQALCIRVGLHCCNEHSTYLPYWMACCISNHILVLRQRFRLGPDTAAAGQLSGRSCADCPRSLSVSDF